MSTKSQILAGAIAIASVDGYRWDDLFEGAQELYLEYSSTAYGAFEEGAEAI